MLRSPHAHAAIRKLDLSAAQAAPGVLAIYTGDDLAAAGLGTMGVPFPTTASGRTARRCSGARISAWRGSGCAMSASRSPFVVAETLAQAKDAAELIDIDYEILPSVTDTAEAAEGKIAVWDECPDNISNLFESRQQGGGRGGASPRRRTSSSGAM